MIFIDKVTVRVHVLVLIMHIILYCTFEGTFVFINIITFYHTLASLQFSLTTYLQFDSTSFSP
jgi:hypothetical protein